MKPRILYWGICISFVFLITVFATMSFHYKSEGKGWESRYQSCLEELSESQGFLYAFDSYNNYRMSLVKYSQWVGEAAKGNKVLILGPAKGLQIGFDNLTQSPTFFGFTVVNPTSSVYKIEFQVNTVKGYFNPEWLIVPKPVTLYGITPFMSVVKDKSLVVFQLSCPSVEPFQFSITCKVFKDGVLVDTIEVQV